MIKEIGTDKRDLFTIRLRADLAIVGGGLSGVCCAITAARLGIQTVLIQDRPVLGGNSSSEVRLWVLGATSHMGNNNRWSRESGVIDELLLENLYRNTEGNPLIFDSILLEKVQQEPNIQLLLNTAVFEVGKKSETEISSLTAFCSQNSTMYMVEAPLFCDASGDGIAAFLAGAAFRMGAESREDFGEKFAPSKEYGELLGHSIYFYSKDLGRPVKFVPPSFALTDITQIPRYKSFNARDFGCRLWWIEYGGRLDTVHDTETIKWELWKVVYGVWNYIKNSGNFPEAENLTLEWVGTIPGKRESRRFEGDYMLTQQDIIEQRIHTDAVAFGGWSIDLHPADGVFSEKPGCNQWHSKGVYQIPYRCLYSRNISNLFLAGRIISASHVAFGSTRVMATGAVTGQAVAHAAALCIAQALQPREIMATARMQQLQQAILKDGIYIPSIVQYDPDDLVHAARISASSELLLARLEADGSWEVLHESLAQMLPVAGGPLPAITVNCRSTTAHSLRVELRKSGRPGNHTPDILLEEQVVQLQEGEQPLTLQFNYHAPDAEYLFICFRKTEAVSIRRSEQRVTGILAVFNTVNKAVSNNGFQHPTEDIGVDSFEFWCPKRRPAGQNAAFSLSAPLKLFGVENVRNGVGRPVNQPNAWVAAWDDPSPSITLAWDQPQEIRTIILGFDTDFDHPMENVLMRHADEIIPFCIEDYDIRDEQGRVLTSVTGNYQTRNVLTLDKPVTTRQLSFHFRKKLAHVPVAVFEIKCY